MFPQNMLDEKTKFHCDVCDYSCSRAFLWKQHLKTDKHNGNAGNARPKPANHQCDVCGKTYRHRSGLWKHKRTCSIKMRQAPDPVESRGSATASGSREDELMAHIASQNRIIESLVPRVGSNNNNSLNVNLFLNERCCNAINMSEFVESLRVGPSDLEFTQTNGIVEGVAAVFVNALKRLDTSMRPIHCTDIGRETLYVRENNAWDNDDNGRRIQRAIQNVAGKHRQAIADWEAANPGWAESEEGKRAYVELVRSITDDVSSNGGTNRIVRSLAQATAVPMADIVLSRTDGDDDKGRH